MPDAVAINDRIGKCQKLLDEDPNSQIFAALAEAHRKNGELDKAFKVCKSGLRIHPKYGSAHVVMAKINLDRGHYDWAETEVKTAIKYDGRTRSVELLLSEIHIYRGEFNKAIKILKNLHETDKNNEQIKKLLDIARKIPEEQTILVSSAKEEKKTEDIDISKQSEGNSEDKEEKYNTVDTLKKAVSTTGIDGALFINNEGLVVESEWTLKMDAAVCGAVMSEIGNKLSPELINNSFGNMNSLLIETTDSVFYQIKQSNGLFLFVGGSKTNLGSIRMKIENLLKRYQE